MDREVWRATVHRVAKSQIWLSNLAQQFLHNMQKYRIVKEIKYEIKDLYKIKISHRLLNIYPHLKIIIKGQKVKVLVTQSCLTLCNPMDYSLPESSVLGILQARILEWVAILFSRGSSWPKGWTWVSCIASRFFTLWATYIYICICICAVFFFFFSTSG